MDTLKGIAIETERTADSSQLETEIFQKKRYFRYNVAQGLQSVGLEEYQKQPEIETVSLTYLTAQEQKFSVRDCARNLRAKQCVFVEDLAYIFLLQIMAKLTPYFFSINTEGIQSSNKSMFLTL